MRLLLVVICALLTLPLVHADAEAKYVEKVKAVFTPFFGSNTVTVVRDVNSDTVKLLPVANITNNFMNRLSSYVPADQSVAAGLLLSQFSTCLTNAGGSLNEYLVVLGTALQEEVTPTFKKAFKKVKKMKKKGKGASAITKKVYGIQTKGLTKKVVQKLIYNIQKHSKQNQYACAVPFLQKILPPNLYNTAWQG